VPRARGGQAGQSAVRLHAGWSSRARRFSPLAARNLLETRSRTPTGRSGSRNRSRGRRHPRLRDRIAPEKVGEIVPAFRRRTGPAWLHGSASHRQEAVRPVRLAGHDRDQPASTRVKCASRMLASIVRRLTRPRVEALHSHRFTRSYLSTRGARTLASRPLNSQQMETQTGRPTERSSHRRCLLPGADAVRSSMPHRRTGTGTPREAGPLHSSQTLDYSSPAARVCLPASTGLLAAGAVGYAFSPSWGSKASSSTSRWNTTASTSRASALCLGQLRVTGCAERLLFFQARSQDKAGLHRAASRAHRGRHRLEQGATSCPTAATASECSCCGRPYKVGERWFVDAVAVPDGRRSRAGRGGATDGRIKADYEPGRRRSRSAAVLTMRGRGAPARRRVPANRQRADARSHAITRRSTVADKGLI